MQQLKMQLRMIINAILDVRYHTGDLDEAQAMALMVDRGVPGGRRGGRQMASGATDRAQLSTYYVGYCEVRDLLRDLRHATPNGRSGGDTTPFSASDLPSSAPARAARTVMAFLDSTNPVAFAHRGFAPDGAENSHGRIRERGAAGLSVPPRRMCG